jgi:hypothetical protein
VMSSLGRLAAACAGAAVARALAVRARVVSRDLAVDFFTAALRPVRQTIDRLANPTVTRRRYPVNQTFVWIGGDDG